MRHSQEAYVDLDVVLASDRGPVIFVVRAGAPVAERGSGALVSSLEAATRSLGARVTWISTTTCRWDARAAASIYASGSAGGDISLDAVYIDPDVYWTYYDDVGVRLLWFAHHDLWDELAVPDVVDVAGLDAYQQVNQLVAERVAGACRPDSLVLLQDYQLAIAPRALRSLAPAQPIAHITHTPFGSPASFRRLPEQVLRMTVDGMLGANLVGFLGRQWADDFLACCELTDVEVDAGRGLVRHRGGETWVRCYPLGVDDEEVTGEEPTPGAPDGRSADPHPESVRRIMSSARLDPAKNAIRGFQAFELLLARRPELRGSVIFRALFVPSRERVPEYQSYARRVAAEIDRINARFPGSIETHTGNSRDEYLAALREYDVLLVNSLRDGMNLVALDGPTVNVRDGCVVLSSAMGSADLLGADALLLRDSRSVEETSQLLDRALAMPASERRRRVAGMRSVIRAHRPDRWIADQITDLRAICRGAEPSSGDW
jgi:trehalose 6-phosphate synthase